MGSIAAKAVGQEVIETLGKSRKVVLGRIARKHGYSLHTADTPKNITNTKSYQAVVLPLVTKLELERNEIIERLKVTRGKAKYRDLIDGFDKITKNLQLITGGATENVNLNVRRLSNEEIRKRLAALKGEE